jgi:hypothetical protein
VVENNVNGMESESPGESAESFDPSDPRRLLVQRILATPDFERSPRLSDFLRYICRLTLEGRSDAISEQHIGEVVFGRPPDYDSGADTIVRSHALRLRRRLEQYFLRAGRNEPLRLVIPRGAYVPNFVPVANTGEEVSEPAQLAPEPGSSLAIVVDAPVVEASDIVSPEVAAVDPRLRRYQLWLAASLGFSLLLAIALGLALRAEHRAGVRQPRNHPLWARLFTTDAPTQIVLGDSGLVLFHATARRYVSLQDYVSGNFSKQLPYVKHVDPDFALFLAGRRYTSFIDAVTLARLLHLPEATPDRTLVHFSRDMRLDDFKNGNIIMIGAQEANPWVELFERSMDFAFTIDTPDQRAAFVNRHPGPGEAALYGGGEPAKVYAVIAFLPNLSGKGNVLLLEGISMTGTEAAVDMVMNDERILPVLRKIRRPDGSLPHFEMLVESDDLSGSAGPARVIAIHVHPG